MLGCSKRNSKMEDSLKRPFVDETLNGVGDILMETGTLDENQSHRKRRRHFSRCSLDSDSDEANGNGNKAVNFILKSDSEDDTDMPDWNQPTMDADQTPIESAIDNIERAFTNQVESTKDLALKAFRRVDSTASELNCLADPNLSENVVDTPEDMRDPFSSLTNQGFLQTESVGSDLKRLNSINSVSTPGTDILSPDIFKGNLQSLKNRDNVMKERLTEPVAKQTSNDLEWIEECPDWLRDDYFDKEMSKIDQDSPRPSSKLGTVSKDDNDDSIMSGASTSSGCLPSVDKTLENTSHCVSISVEGRKRNKSVSLPEETDKAKDDETSSNNLGVFEPDDDLNDAQKHTKKFKRLKFRKRHCSRGKMGPPPYYKTSQIEIGDENGEENDVDEEDFSLKGRGKNWPPKFSNQIQIPVCTDAQSKSTNPSDTDGTQEYEMSYSQDIEKMCSHDQNHNDNMHLKTASRLDEKATVVADASVDGITHETVSLGHKETEVMAGSSVIKPDMERKDISKVVSSGITLDSVMTSTETNDGKGRRSKLKSVTPTLKAVDRLDDSSRPFVKDTILIEKDVVTDAIPYDEVDAAVISSQSDRQTDTSNTNNNATNLVRENYYSNNQSSSGARVLLEKIPSLQQDAQNIANILGGSNIDTGRIYEKLNERRQDDNRVEMVMNDILEGNFVVETSAGNVRLGGEDEGANAIENVVEGTSAGEEDCDVLVETQIVLKKLQEDHDTKDVDPNEVFGLVETCATSFHSRTERINKVISQVIAISKQPVNTSAADKQNDEDLFLQDVDQLVRKFPDVDQFQIYSLLDANRGENDRVDIVVKELKKAGNVDVVPVTGARGDEDPLYRDMIQIARLFPNKDRNEIYAYLEAHHDERDRVQVVTEEFLRMSQDGDVEIIAEEPAPAARPSSSSATEATGIKNDLDVSMEEQVQNLSAIFPDCDPNYLYEQLEGLKNDPDRVKNLASTMFDRRNYPKKKDVLDEQRKHEGRLKALGMLSTFRLNEFLELFPDPAAVFYSEEKPVSDAYKKHVFVHLMNTFPYLQEKHIKTVMETHKNHLTTSLRELEKEVAAADLRTKQSRSKYPQKFLKIKRANSRHVKFPDEPDEYFYKELAFTRNEVKIKDHLATQKKVRECKIERAKKNGELYECQCCFDDEILFEEMKACIDGHLFCAECVRRSAEENIGSSKLRFPCLNGECKETFTMKTLQEVLLSNVFSGLLKKIQEEEVKQAGIENLVSCPFCSFATIMEDENDKVLRCQNPDCLKESCRLCQEPNHIPLKCEEVEKQGQTNMRTYIENKISEAMIRTCWKCKQRFYKIEGCNKMTCSCGASMCYVCRAPNINYDHFGSSVDGKCPPQTDIYELHRREMEKAGLGAKKEYEEDHPEATGELKFDPMQHVKDAPAHHPLHRGGYDDDDDDDEDDEEEEEEDYSDEYGERDNSDEEEEEEEEDNGWMWYGNPYR